MQLKRYQERVIREVRVFLDALAKHQEHGEKHPSMDAWADARKHFRIHGDYRERRNGLGRDLPAFCLKVPTGGGKTLLATQVLGAAYQTVLRPRNGAGLVLWVVPSDQIYKDTLKALKDRRHPYRQSLEHAVSRRIEVWEKHEILRLTPTQLAANLNVLLLILAGTNRETREQLRFFRDSGGNIVQHFPPEDDPGGHRRFKERIQNLEMLSEEPGQHLVKTSIANLVRLSEPPVILDEGHKATSELARRTIAGFNASLVVELSATPHKEANVLVRVSGQELLDEEMIKLPINIGASDLRSWKDCLTIARDRREELARSARKHFERTGEAIRPIVLVQVERTGADQRDAGFVHSEDVKEHLVQRLGIPARAIAIKTSEKDDIEGIDLLDDGCPIEWIVTRAALQEGWDCPFAYVLVSLSNVGNRMSMTQLVGRILRQPRGEKTGFPELNESYIYCLRRRAADLTREVKAALEKEGYEGELESVVDRSGETGGTSPVQVASIRKEFRRLYRRPFEGKIYLPRFCVREDGGRNAGLDYFRHLLAAVDVERFAYDGIDWDFSMEMAAAQDVLYRITLGQEDVERVGSSPGAPVESDDQIGRWLVACLPFEHVGFKSAWRIVARVRARLYEAVPQLKGQLALVKFALLERIKGFIERETDRQTEEAFRRLFEEDRLRFYLHCIECRFEIPAKIEIRPLGKRLVRENNEPVQRSLFDYVPAESMNEYERAVALCLDAHPQVLWWYRNLVGPENFSIQGYQRGRIFPDFVVQVAPEAKPAPRVLLVESKGRHLKGSEETTYKSRVADYFERLGRNVTWQELGKGFANRQFRFQVLDQGNYPDQEWRESLRRLFEAGPPPP